MTTTRSGRLIDLRGETVSFTGFLSRKRDEYIALIKRTGGSHQKHVSSGTTVMVRGTPNIQYKWGNRGTRLDDVDTLLEFGFRVFVINEMELIQLLDGEPLSLAESKAACAPPPSLPRVGVPFRSPGRRSSSKGSTSAGLATVDLDELDRRTAEHHDLVDEVAERVHAQDRSPISPARIDCLFDVGWERGSTFHVVEVKTLSVGSETQQMRLGLGQVLDYRHTLRDFYPRVVAHLVLSDRPSDPRMVDVCEEQRVRVSWPPHFDGLLD